MCAKYPAECAGLEYIFTRESPRLFGEITCEPCSATAQHSRPFYRIVLEGNKSIMHAIERPGLYMRRDRDSSRLGKKIPPILSRIVRNRSDYSLVVEVRVWKRGDRAHVNPSKHEYATSVKRLQCRRNYFTGRSENN